MRRLEREERERDVVEIRKQYFVLFKDTPFLAFKWLGAFFVVTPLNGISHGRHADIEMHCIWISTKNERDLKSCEVYFIKMCVKKPQI